MKLPEKDKCYGILAGLEAGDTVGAAYETWEPDAIAADIAKRGGLVMFDYDDPFGKDGRFPAGRPTDDSELAAALAISLVTTGGAKEDLYQRFRGCTIDHKSLLCNLPAYGFGGTTRRALQAPTYYDACILHASDPRPPIPSNGALMRTAPVAIRHYGDTEKLIEVAERAALITHRDRLAVDCAIAYTKILDSVLRDSHLKDAAWHTVSGPVGDCIDNEELKTLLGSGNFRKPEWLPKNRWGGALHTLKVALWAAQSASSFEDGITLAVSFGGDTDTYAAVAGGLLGAIYGVSGIPRKWIDPMRDKGYMRMMRLAEKLRGIREEELL